jgi:hypothetical protein
LRPHTIQCKQQVAIVDGTFGGNTKKLSATETFAIKVALSHVPARRGLPPTDCIQGRFNLLHLCGADLVVGEAERFSQTHHTDGTY